MEKEEGGVKGVLESASAAEENGCQRMLKVGFCLLMALKESLKARSRMSMERRTTCGGGRGGCFTLQNSNFAISKVLTIIQNCRGTHVMK